MNKKNLGLVTAISIVGLILRFYGLGRQSLWFDEAYSVFVARQDLGFSFELLVSDSVHPPLYYLIQRLAAPLGDGEAIVRLPAMAFGVAAIPLMYVLGSRLSGERTGLLAAALAALAPFHIWYSQEARMYSALVMFTILCMIAYERILEEGRQSKDDLLFIAASGLAYITHYFALFIPLIQLVHIGINFKRLHKDLVRWAVLQALAATPLILWLVMVYTQPQVFAGIGWISQPDLRDILYTIINFVVGFVDGADPLRWLAAISFGVLAAIGVRSVWQMKTAASLTLTWALLPLLVTFLISLRRPIYIDRFMILSLPAFWLLAAKGLSSMPAKPRAVTGSLLVLLMGYGIATFNFGPRQLKEDWRSAVSVMQSAEEDEVLIVRTLQMVIPMAYYHPAAPPIESVEINRVFTPISELASQGSGSWLLYWSPAADAHSVAATEVLDLSRDSDEEVVSWMNGEGPTIMLRKDLPDLTVFHFDELQP